MFLKLLINSFNAKLLLNLHFNSLTTFAIKFLALLIFLQHSTQSQSPLSFSLFTLPFEPFVQPSMVFDLSNALKMPKLQNFAIVLATKPFDSTPSPASPTSTTSPSAG